MNPTEGILRSLLRYDRPLDELLEELEASLVEERSPDSEEEEEELEVLFGPADAVCVLSQFLEGDLDATEVEEWGAIVEARDEILLEPESEGILREFLEDAAQLTRASAESWLDRLDDDE